MAPSHSGAVAAGSSSAVLAGIVLMWPPPFPPPRPGMSEETRQSKLAAAKKKVKRAGSRLPDPARDPSDGRAMARVCCLRGTRGEPLGAPWRPPPKVFSASPAPRQPSPRPRSSPRGDFGPVTPGASRTRLGPRLLPPRTGPPGFPGLPVSRTSVLALRSPPPPLNGDSGIGREEWKVVTS